MGRCRVRMVLAGAGAAVCAAPLAVIGGAQAGAVPAGIVVAPAGGWGKAIEASGTAALHRGSEALVTSRLASGSSAYDWPELHRDPQLGGYAANGTVSTANAGSLGVRWAVDLYSATLDSPVIAYDSSLHETVAYVGTDQGNFYAINLATGAIVWADNLSGPVRSSPLVSDGAVWVGTVSSPTIYKLNASTGAIECSQKATAPLLSSPVAATPPGGTASVYFATDDVFSISAATCAVQWTFSGGTTGTWDPLAYVVDATGEPLVLFGSDDPTDTAYAADAVTGAEVWHYKTAKGHDFDIGSGLTISVPGVNGFADGVAYVPGKDGFVYALDLATGAVLWTASLGSSGGEPNESLSTAALDGTNLVVGDAIGVEDLNAMTGALVWSYHTPTTSKIVPPGSSEVISSPAISGSAGHEVVAFGDLGGAFRVLSLATGAQVYDYRTGSWLSGSPAISKGDILVGSSDGFLYDFSAGSGNARPVAAITSPAFRSTVANPRGHLRVLGTASDSAGVVAVVTAIRQGGSSGKWWDTRTSKWSTTPVTERAILTTPRATSTTWSVSFPVPSSGNAYRVDAYAVSANGPATVPAAVDEFFVRPKRSGPTLGLSPEFVGPGGSVSISGTGFGPREKTTVSLLTTVVGHVTSRADGSLPAFKVTIPSTAEFGPTALMATSTGAAIKKAAAGIFITDSWPQLGDGPEHAGFEANDPIITNTVDPGQNVLLDPGWHFSASAALTSPAVADQVVYVGDQSGILHAVRAHNGTQLWRWRTPHGVAITGSPAVDSAKALVLVGGANGTLYAISTSGARAGKLSWSARIGKGDVQSPLLAGTDVYVAATGGQVAALSKSTGSRVWLTTVAGVSAAPAFNWSGHALLVPTNTSLTALNASTGHSLWTFSVTKPTSPVVSADVAYVGSTDHHVYAVSETTGQQIWTFATGGAIQDSGALISSNRTQGTERLYIGSADGNLYSLNAATGAELTDYSYPLGASVTGVAIAGSAVLVTTSSGLVGCLRTYGSLAWEYATDGRLLRPPAVVDGTFFAAGLGGTLWAFTPYGAAPQ
jgi:eukaryotic-like serine/threonine-protein kinase